MMYSYFLKQALIQVNRAFYEYYKNKYSLRGDVTEEAASYELLRAIADNYGYSLVKQDSQK